MEPAISGGMIFWTVLYRRGCDWPPIPFALSREKYHSTLASGISQQLVRFSNQIADILIAVDVAAGSGVDDLKAVINCDSRLEEGRIEIEGRKFKVRRL